MAEIGSTNNIKPADIVLIARDTTASCEWNNLFKNFKWRLKRLKIIKA
jgi:RNase P protein component